DDRSWHSENCAPNGSIRWTWRHGVKGPGDAFIFGRIDGLIGFDVIIALAIAIGVEDERCPTLRQTLIACFIENFPIEPADRVSPAAGAGPKRLIGVIAELQMMRAEAGIDQGDLAARGIIDGKLPIGAGKRKEFGREQIGARFAKGWVVRRTN